jgi:hypothetical protein
LLLLGWSKVDNAAVEGADPESVVSNVYVPQDFA